VHSWPKSAWKQAAISFVVAAFTAFDVMSYIFGEFFNSFYFRRKAHLGWTAGLTRQSSLLEFGAVGVEVLIAIFMLLFALQRAFTVRKLSKSN
jgi:hypothetical protein